MLHQDLLARLCRARDLLRDLESGPRSIGAVAREVGMSPFHFIRVFKAVFGATPHQVQSQAQLEKAKHLLILADCSVTEVCMMVGFSSLGSFSSLFTRRVGVSPSVFQRSNRLMSGEPKRLPPALVPGCFSLMGAAPSQVRNFEEADVGACC